jgi:hypothetical protein
MSPEPHWIEAISRKVLSLFSIKEVKTPLSFFFRTVSAIVVLGVIALFTLEPLYRYRMLLGAAGLLILLAVIVAVFAWFKPKNLVYGETGHRAETKLSFGTETKALSESEIVNMPGTTNPKEALTSGGDR